MTAYYNEIDHTAAHVLECLIKDGVIAPGVVDRRSIADVEPADVRGFKQAHFFAGGGIWSVAARLAKWDDDRELWTGSCPCQPFSVAGKGAGQDDPRHLWPHFFRLIRACRPPVVVGEQVAGKAGYGWFDGVRSDLEREDYASRAVDIPACAVDAPHIRQRLYWVAMVNADSSGRREQGGAISVSSQQPGAQCTSGHAYLDNAECDGRGTRRDFDAEHVGDIARAASEHGGMADADSGGRRRGTEIQERRQEQGAVAERVGGGDMADADGAKPGRGQFGFQPFGGSDRGSSPEQECRSFWHDAEWLTGADGKARRSKSGVRLLVDGLSGRVGLIRIGGNAIVAPLAAKVLEALMEPGHGKNKT